MVKHVKDNTAKIDMRQTWGWSKCSILSFFPKYSVVILEPVQKYFTTNRFTHKVNTITKNCH